MSKQVYVPVGFAGLRGWVQGNRSLHPGWGVAADLREAVHADDMELRHYEALWVAAETSEAQALPHGEEGVGRRVVLTVEVGDDAPEDENGVVGLPEALAEHDVVCAHVEESNAGVEDELLWYDPSEFAAVASESATKGDAAAR